MSADIVVIGAGVIGASIAYHLAARGCGDVLVVDRGPDFGSGSTSKATGGFRAQFDSAINVELSKLSRQKLLRFEEEIGVDSGYRPYGYLFLACSKDELSALEAAQAVQHACGLNEARMVSAREARELSPATTGDASILGGAFCPTDGFIRAMNILRGYADAARRLGVRFQFNTEVEDVEAPIVINARGAWAGAPITPLRRNAIATVPTDVFDDKLPMTIWSGDWFHLRVRDGRVLLLWPDDPPIDDDAWFAEVLRMTRERVPALRDVAIGERWSGLYEMTPDGHALLGRSPERENVYIAAGGCGHGVMHAPALGQLMAEMIVDGKTSIDVSALRPDRFGVAPPPRR